jgi:Kdo2-lipid IVA lauroyltransferase/acyltransferase
MFFIRLLTKLPLRVLYFLSDICSWILYHIVRYRRKIVYDNIKNSFPEKSPSELKGITREFYTRFTDYVVETLKIVDMSNDEIRSKVEVNCDDDFLEAAKRKKSVILLVSHKFNWELGVHATRLTVDAIFEGAYKRLSNKKLDAFLLSSRQHTGSKMIEKSDLIKHVIRTRNEPKVLVLLADQRPRRTGPQYWTSFLHQETSFVRGPESLAKLMNASTYLFSIERTRRGHYRVNVTRLTDPPYEKDDSTILEAYARGLENIIRNDPAGYLWSHKRWKYKR